MAKRQERFLPFLCAVPRGRCGGNMPSFSRIFALDKILDIIQNGMGNEQLSIA